MDEPVVRPAAPPVVMWYKVYCIAMAVMYLFVVAAGVFFLVGGAFIPLNSDDKIPFMIMGPLYVVMGLALMIPFVLALFLPPKSWVWVYGIVLIAIGLSSCCCLPAALPLLIFWVKADVQRHFGREE
ncbi:MAG: hypothetical protein NTU88_15390 [Armatimonadetes bacterium]|nr:hypothetical protein [Armatimonadota bacterium]